MTNNRIVSSYLDGFNGSDEILLVGPMPADRLAITEPVIFVDGGSNRREKTIGNLLGRAADRGTLIRDLRRLDRHPMFADKCAVVRSERRK